MNSYLFINSTRFWNSIIGLYVILIHYEDNLNEINIIDFLSEIRTHHFSILIFYFFDKAL